MNIFSLDLSNPFINFEHYLDLSGKIWNMKWICFPPSLLAVSLQYSRWSFHLSVNLISGAFIADFQRHRTERCRMDQLSHKPFLFRKICNGDSICTRLAFRTHREEPSCNKVPLALSVLTKVTKSLRMQPNFNNFEEYSFNILSIHSFCGIIWATVWGTATAVKVNEGFARKAADITLFIWLSDLSQFLIMTAIASWWTFLLTKYPPTDRSFERTWSTESNPNSLAHTTNPDRLCAFLWHALGLGFVLC